MKTSSDVLDGINSLERRFAVSEWRASDIDLWPTYRFRLYGNAVNRMLLAHTPGGPLERVRQLASRAARALLRVPLAA
jgi:hypothetical protein